MAAPTEPPRTGRDVMTTFLPQSPFVAKLGIVAEVLEEDRVRLKLPWDESNTTIGDMVHGGAIATLADIAVMAAAWCGAPAVNSLRGVTVSMALQYLAPARATDLFGEGRAIRGVRWSTARQKSSRPTANWWPRRSPPTRSADR